MGFFNNFPYTNFHELNEDWIVQIIKKLDETYPGIIDNLNKTVNELKNSINGIDQRVEDLEVNGLKENVEKVIKEYIASMIFVEISDAGYITYNIPGEWENITFNTTGVDITLEMQPEYGHLVLSY